MPEERAVAPDQANVAHDVLEGKREITASVPKEAPPGMSPNDDRLSALNDSPRAQALDAGKGIAGAQEWRQSNISLETNSWEKTPALQEQSRSPAAEQTQEASRAFQESGVTAKEELSTERTAEIKSILDKRAQTSQNGPPKDGGPSDGGTSGGSRLEAARQEAAAAPPGPAPSPSMEK